MNKEEKIQIILAIEYIVQKLKDGNSTEIDIELLERVRKKLNKELKEE